MAKYMGKSSDEIWKLAMGNKQQSGQQEQASTQTGGKTSTSGGKYSGMSADDIWKSVMEGGGQEAGQTGLGTAASDTGYQKWLRDYDTVSNKYYSWAKKNSGEGKWKADSFGGTKEAMESLLDQYDDISQGLDEKDKPQFKKVYDGLKQTYDALSESEKYYAQFRDQDDYDRARSGYTNFGVGYAAESYGLDDAQARALRQEQVQKDARERQRALAEYVSAKKEFESSDVYMEYRIHNKGDSDGGAYSDEYEEDLNSRYNQARAKVVKAENALLNAQSRMNAYNVGWGKIDRYADTTEAAKGTDTSYTGPSYDALNDWENKRQEELNREYVPGELTYTEDKRPEAEDRLGLWLSMTEEQRQLAAQSAAPALQTLAAEADSGLWNALEDTEIQTYYYLRNSQGQEAANQYLSDMEPELNRRTDEKFIEKVQNASTAARWGYEAAAHALAIAGNVTGFAGEMNETITGNHKAYSSTGRASRYASYIRGINGQSFGEFAENVAKNAGASEEFASGAAKYAENIYQAVNSGVDSAIGANLLGPAYLATMGMGAYAQRSEELELRGASNRQIAVGAVGAGCIEMLFEKVSLDHFFDNFIKTPPKSWKELIAKTLVQAGIEGSEEINTEIANIAFDAINMGKNCDVSMSIREYMAQGLSEEEAKKRATVDAVTDIYWAGFGGFVSGGVMAGVSGTAKMGLSKADNAMDNYDIGKPLLANGRVADLQAQAEALTDAKKSAKLSKAAQEVAHNASVGDNSLLNTYKTGKVASQIAREAGREASRAEVTEFRKAAEKYLEGQRDIQNKKLALNVLTRVYDGTAMLPGDKAYMRMIGGEKLTQEILNSVGGKETLQENAKPSVAASMRTIGNVQSSVLGIAPETKAEFDSDNSGQAFRKSDSEPINILASEPIARVENGVLYLNTDDGQEIAASDVSYGNSGEAAVYAAISNMQTDTETARNLLNGIDDSGLSSSAYARAIQNAYYRGMNGVKFEDTPGYSDAAKLPEAQRRAAWEAGKQRRAAKVQEREALIDSGKSGTRESGVTMQESAKSIRSLNKQQQTGMAAAKALAAAGLHVEVYASTEAERKAGKPNGVYRKADGSIAIDLNAGDNGQGAVAYALAHETTHFIKDYSPAKFETYAELIIAAAESKGISYDSLLARQLARLSEMEEYKNLSETELQDIAYDETIAEMSETILTDTDAASRLSQQIYKQDRTLWQKIKDFFTGLVEKLRNAYRDSDPDSDIGRMLKRAVQDNAEIAQAWAEAVAEAGENYQLQDGQKKNAREGERLSLRGKTQQELTANFQAEVDNVLDNPYTSGKQLIVGYTPSLYESLGMPSLPLTIGSGHVYSAAKTEAQAKQDGNFHKGVHYHGLGNAAVKNIYSAIQDPIMVIEAKDVNKNASPLRSTHSVVAIVDIGTAQKSLLVPIEITAERKVNGTQMDVNTISSIYEKSVGNLVNEAIALENSGDVGIFYAKKEATALPVAGVQFPAQLQQQIASNSIVHRLSEKVNMKVSEATQSRQFKRWFGDWQNDPANASKVVNEDGTPKVLYHQTSADFTIFEPRHEGAGTRDQDTPFGIFMKSSDRNIGVKGEKQMALYARIVNPLRVTDRADLMYQLKKISPEYEKVSAELRSLNDAYQQKHEDAKKAFADYIVKWRQENPNASRTAIYDDAGFNEVYEAEDNVLDEWETEARKVELRSKEAITRDLEKQGYDGVIIRTDKGSFGRSTDAYIALHPEQVKSATDNVGTFDKANPDIRYSTRNARDSVGDLQADLYQLKEQRKKLLEDDPAYRAAVEQRRYANTFTERVSASKALKAAESNVDTSAIDSRITELQDRITEIRESKIRQHREEQEKYSGTKTGGYSLEPDTRLNDLDVDYSEAVKSGNRRKMQALVDRAAEAAMPKSVVRDESGKLLKVYHYTNNDFTVFDRGMARTGNEMDGFFFAPDTESTREYGKRRIAAYLNITNLALDPVLDREFDDSGTLLREKLAAQGYDGVARTENGKIYEYMVFDSNQVKYADAVTYDDDGNVIPLSQRFDTGNEDIRYSSRNSGESRVDRLVRKNEELKAEAEYLKQVVQIQKQGNRKNLRDRESVNAIAKGILESVNAKDTEFGKKLNDFYRDLVTVEMDYDTMQEKAGELADRALEHHQAERDGYAQEVLDFLKKRRVSLTESQIGDAEYTYGSLSEFKKAIRGSIILDQNSTTSLDQLWQEAAARFPDRFGADTTEADMADGIANIVSWANSAEADSETEFQYYKAETKADLTQKILMGFLDAKPIESVSDTLKQQLADLKQQHKQEMKELRRSWDEEAKAMERSHRYDLEAERKRGKAAVEALKYQQEVIQKAQEGLWEAERADIKRSYEKQMRELREQNTQKAHEKVESRHRTEERHKLQNTIDTLNRMLLRPTNTSHVPQELQSSVAMAMKVINGVILDSKTGQNADRLAKYAEQLRKLEGNPEDNAEKIADLNRKIGDLTGRDISMKAALTSLQEQYAKLEGQDGVLYDENIEALIEDAKETIGNTAYKDLSLKQLKAVRDTYTALLTTIRNANKAFVAGQNARIDDMVKRATIELSMKGKKKPTQTAIGKKVDQFFWNNEKPVYAFERIGSAVMSELYRNLRNGEDTFYRDVNSAREFFLGAAEKDGFDKWDLDELQEFEASNGQKFQLSLDERMSLYAYSLRPQARDHLTKGGIVLAENTKRLQQGPLGVTMEVTYDDANAYTLTDETIDAIVNSLTKEQRQFAFEMQQYLAKVMGAKGDEVNMAMYGIKKFGEETYWPLKSSGVFSERIREQQERTGNKVKNSGFTKALTQHANNAIELSSLTETWAQHVNDMSMYHAFTLPMEDFYRVYNWTQKGDSKGKQTIGVRQMIQQTAGKGAVTYIDQFLKDLNGGLRADPRETVEKALVSSFKKAAVGASLSVAIQQPSAVGRALAYIEANYFIGSKVESAGGIKETWDQLKKYAAVAGLKEMGRFDVDMGKSTLEYIIGRNGLSTWGKITDKVDKLSGWLPEMADQVTWCGIWEAAKRKTAAQNPGLKGESLLQKAGELFTDTITRTQVYDSVFSRSSHMRAKTGLKSMVTSFMAEPTTTANMVEDAIRKFKGGDKRMSAKILSSVAVATVLNAALASVVYAARDDDDDKTYWEKYMASLAGETVDSLNPLTYIPILSDINNLLLGYSIERTDMALASDLVTDLKKVFMLYEKYDDEWSDEEKKEWKKNVRDAWLDNAWMVGTVMGLPLKNVVRDVESVFNTARNPSNGADMSADTVLKAVKDSARKNFPILSWKADESSSDQLYNAITQRKDVLARRLKAQFGDEKKYESALLKGLRENDPRIKTAAQYAIDENTPKRVAIIREIVAEGHYTQDQVIKAINQKANSMKEKTKSGKESPPEKLYDYSEYVNAAANGLGYAVDVRKELIRYQADRNQEADGKLTRQEAESDALKTFQSNVKSDAKDGYATGELTEAQVRKVLTAADIAEDEELDDLILQWDTELELGDEISWSNARYLDYAETIHPAGISADTYDSYIRAVSKLSSIDEDGDGKTDITRQEQVIEYIDSMPISDAQKDTLFQAEYPKARKSVLRNLPWR